MAKMMVEDQSLAQPSGEDKRTADALADIRDAFPKRFVAQWKCYESRKEVSPKVIAEWKRSGIREVDLLGNDYSAKNPCPAPVKIDQNKGWTPDNVRDCGHIVTGCTGRTAYARACVHAEEHYEWWYDTKVEEYRATHDGKDGPPMTTNIKLPHWQDDDSNMPLGTSPIDQKIEVERRRMEEENAKKDEEDALKPKARK